MFALSDTQTRFLDSSNSTLQFNKKWWKGWLIIFTLGFFHTERGWTRKGRFTLQCLTERMKTAHAPKCWRLWVNIVHKNTGCDVRRKVDAEALKFLDYWRLKSQHVYSYVVSLSRTCRTVREPLPTCSYEIQIRWSFSVFHKIVIRIFSMKRKGQIQPTFKGFQNLQHMSIKFTISTTYNCFGGYQLKTKIEGSVL